MNETTAARRDRTYGIAISSAVLLLMLLGFEGFLRLTYEEHRPGEGSCGIFSDTLLWSTKPFCGGTNSRGYRDHEHQLEKPEGVFRIVILGDSVVHGYRIEDLNDTFAKVLERRLNESAEGRSTETILLARGGYTTQQQLTLLRDEALAYGPDLILLNYVLNDPPEPDLPPDTLQRAEVWLSEQVAQADESRRRVRAAEALLPQREVERARLPGRVSPLHPLCLPR